MRVTEEIKQQINEKLQQSIDLRARGLPPIFSTVPPRASKILI